MKSFEFTQKMFNLFRIHSINDDPSTRERIVGVICFGAIILNLRMVLFSAIVSIYQNVNEIDQCLFSSQTIAIAIILYSLVHAYPRCGQIAEIFSMF